MNGAVRSLSIGIPAFNEEEMLPQVLDHASRVIDELGIDGEIIVVDDGSRDRTRAICREAAAKDARIRVVEHATNEGFGATLRDVFTTPKKDWIFLIPGDGQVLADEVKKLLPHAESAEYILGLRRLRLDPGIRSFQSWVYNVLVSLLMGRRIRDVNTVLLVKRSAIDGIVLESKSVFLHAELALKAQARGARIIEIPITHRPRLGGKALGSKPSTILHTLADYLAYWRRGPR